MPLLIESPETIASKNAISNLNCFVTLENQYFSVHVCLSLRNCVQSKYFYVLIHILFS